MGSKSEASKGKLPRERSVHGIDCLTQNVADMSLNVSQEGKAIKPQSDLRGYESRNSTSSPGIAPPLDHGWTWASRAGASQPKPLTDEGKEELISYPDHGVLDGNKDDEDEDDAYSDDDDDDLLSDDSDASSQSHGTRKNHRMLKAFFEVLDKLSVDEINEPARQWHCPACQGGPGAIEWYRGLQPLFTHARTKGSKRMKLHREFAELLDEELCRRGTCVIPAGESFGQWRD
ncbi:hypothetical protein Nepgr_028903 [Nepenthes gracilis]|uniref:Zinc finger-XS domain-containing protein n=1 Tax=Nepenthes gracilis TaxID=150966 RepID=A0AAD3Y4D0_NEPGR|nr:hypothetical protein Nepgr_028903 [Nepenthes gracilis]